jgi:hypothetical protein
MNQSIMVKVGGNGSRRTSVMREPQDFTFEVALQCPCERLQSVRTERPVFNRTIGLRDTFAKEVGGKG